MSAALLCAALLCAALLCAALLCAALLCASAVGCAEAVAALLRRSPLHFTVSYIGPHEQGKLTAAGLRGVGLYAQSGGNESVAQATRALGPRAVRAIKAYVTGGGATRRAIISDRYGNTLQVAQPRFHCSSTPGHPKG